MNKNIKNINFEGIVAMLLLPIRGQNIVSESLRREK
jgi:hypothetical protein